MNRLWRRTKTAAVAAMERKVKAQITAGSIAAAVVWTAGQFGYTDLGPSWRGLIDVAAPVIAGAAAGWLARHTPRSGDLGSA